MGIEALLTSQIIGFAEGIDDRVSSLLIAGNGIELTYNDVAGTLTIANTGLGGSTGSTDNRVLRSDGTGGATVQNSAVTIDDSGNISGLGTVGCGAITAPSIGNTGATPVAFATNGNVTFPASVYFGSGNYVGFTNRALLNSPSDGVLQINNWAANALGSLNCGAITASGTSQINSLPAGGGLVLVPSATHNAFHGLRLCSTSAASERAVFLVQPTSGEIMIGANNGGGYYPVIYSNGTARLSFATTGQATFSHLVIVGVFTVATLPAAAANAGALAQITDSSVTTNGTIAAGGGSDRAIVFSDGTDWIVAVA